MFLVRSAFWLTAAYLVIHPGNVDLGATASAVSGQAMAAGQAIIVQQILKNDCSLTKCAPAAQVVALAASARNPIRRPHHAGFVGNQPGTDPPIATRLDGLKPGVASLPRRYSN